MTAPKITFIGAGSTIFVKNILGDVFHREALKSAHIALMDIDPTRLEESHIVVRKLMWRTGPEHGDMPLFYLYNLIVDQILHVPVKGDIHLDLTMPVTGGHRMWRA